MERSGVALQGSQRGPVYMNQGTKGGACSASAPNTLFSGRVPSLSSELTHAARASFKKQCQFKGGKAAPRKVHCSRGAPKGVTRSCELCRVCDMSHEARDATPVIYSAYLMPVGRDKPMDKPAAIGTLDAASTV